MACPVAVLNTIPHLLFKIQIPWNEFEYPLTICGLRWKLNLFEDCESQVFSEDSQGTQVILQFSWEFSQLWTIYNFTRVDTTLFSVNHTDFRQTLSILASHWSNLSNQGFWLVIHCLRRNLTAWGKYVRSLSLDKSDITISQQTFDMYNMRFDDSYVNDF